MQKIRQAIRAIIRWVSPKEKLIFNAPCVAIGFDGANDEIPLINVVNLRDVNAITLEVVLKVE